MQDLPRGSKYPIFEDSGSKNQTNGIWDQRPEVLGTWTLCAVETALAFLGLDCLLLQSCTPWLCLGLPQRVQIAQSR